MRECNLCGGGLVLLGTLGDTEHSKCVCCGMVYSNKPSEDGELVEAFPRDEYGVAA